MKIHLYFFFFLDTVRFSRLLWDIGEDVTVAGMLEEFGRRREVWTVWSMSRP